MAAIFYIIGYLIVAVGLAWSTLMLFLPGQPPTPNYYGALTEIIGRAVITSPGLGVMVVGLMFLAIGRVLHRLDQLVDR